MSIKKDPYQAATERVNRDMSRINQRYMALANELIMESEHPTSQTPDLELDLDLDFDSGSQWTVEETVNSVGKAAFRVVNGHEKHPTLYPARHLADHVAKALNDGDHTTVQKIDQLLVKLRDAIREYKANPAKAASAKKTIDKIRAILRV
ncbi:MAG: hypothetical protein D6698_11930 [Gammaproteobacteria bacterium]|nr:MAG: hypothetical protein D6698_11930 [Gammaproteobacteria bacterium]